MTSTEVITLDPEFEAILREVAADPDSSLLRIPRPKRIRSLFDRQPPVGVLEPGLTRAERHLVQVHRSELAWLLRQACLVKLVEGPRSRLFVIRYVAPDREVSLLRPGELRRHVEEEREAAMGLEDGSSALELLDRCVADPLGVAPSVAGLAAASFRLERTDEARIMAAMELTQVNGPRSAVVLLQDVLSGPTRPGGATSAWATLGLAHSRLLEFDRAQQAYACLCTVDKTILTGWSGRLTMSLQLGEEAQAVACAKPLEELAMHASSFIDQCTDVLVARRKEGEWVPTAKAARLVPAVADKLEPAARRIAHAFA